MNALVGGFRQPVRKGNMQTIATCAACGGKKELFDSCRIDGIQQPRVCKDCLIRSMRTGDYGVNDLYWLVQLGELNDTESIEALKANSAICLKEAGKGEG